MRFENDQGWVEIEFENYANETGAWRNGLTDERNCVELGFRFSLKEIGWGCVGGEYFLTTDIKVLAEGTSAVLASVTDSFSHSVSFPYEVICEEKEFCRISFSGRCSCRAAAARRMVSKPRSVHASMTISPLALRACRS